MTRGPDSNFGPSFAGGQVLYESTQNCLTLVAPNIIIMATSSLPSDSIMLVEESGLPVSGPFVLENSGVIVSLVGDVLRTDGPLPGAEWLQLPLPGGTDGYMVDAAAPERFLVQDGTGIAMALIDESLQLSFSYNEIEKYYSVSCDGKAVGSRAFLTNQGDGSVAFVEDEGGGPRSGQKWKFKKITTVVMMSATDWFPAAE